MRRSQVKRIRAAVARASNFNEDWYRDHRSRGGRPTKRRDLVQGKISSRGVVTGVSFTRVKKMVAITLADDEDMVETLFDKTLALFRCARYIADGRSRARGRFSRLMVSATAADEVKTRACRDSRIVEAVSPWYSAFQVPIYRGQRTSENLITDCWGRALSFIRSAERRRNRLLSFSDFAMVTENS